MLFGSFHEAEHLTGDTNMVVLIDAALQEEQRRRAAGRKDCSIPFRPDHGQDILDDLKRKAQPGYPAIGRLRCPAFCVCGSGLDAILPGCDGCGGVLCAARSAGIRDSGSRAR
ncbi:mannonate dehydratase [Castellaniella sp.]|uniref:mannonate dehydratase n=1 Tax=Castellaniella sp. TaxID=1955812 RepID=UPI003C707FA6